MSKILQSTRFRPTSRRQNTDLIAQSLHNDPVIDRLEFDAIEEMVHAAKVEHYEVPTLLGAAQSQIDAIRFVVSGHVEILGRNPDGDEACIAVLGKGGWLTWLACFDDTPPNHDFYSSANAVLIAIPCKRMRDIADRYPELYRIAIRAISYRFRLLMEWTTDSALLESEYRVAKLLSVVSRLNAAPGELSPIPYTQDELARLSRCARQTLSRSLRLLAQQGIIELGYKRIDIVSREALESFILSSQTR